VKDPEDNTPQHEEKQIVLAIREGIGHWEASRAEVVDGVLIMRRAERQRECCGADLTLVAEARRGSMTWELRRCLTCEREYSIGPALPPTWVTALARRCIDLYAEYQAAVAEAYGRRLRGCRGD
jgi:hypothetical protein